MTLPELIASPRSASIHDLRRLSSREVTTFFRAVAEANLDDPTLVGDLRDRWRRESTAECERIRRIGRTLGSPGTSPTSPAGSGTPTTPAA